MKRAAALVKTFEQRKSEKEVNNPEGSNFASDFF